MTMKRTNAKGPAIAGPTFSEVLGLDGRPSGFADVRVLLRAHDAGDPLPIAPLGRILDAMRAFLGAESTDVQLQEFGRRANLRGKQGGRPTTAGDAEPHVLAVVEVLRRSRRKVADGMTPRKAMAAAKREVAKERHCALKTMQDDVVKYDADAHALLVAIDYAERLEAQERAFIEGLSRRLKSENKS